MKYYVGAQLSYQGTVREYMAITAEDINDAKQQMYDYLKERVPASASEVKVDVMSVREVE